MNDQLERAFDALLIVRFQAGDNEAIEELVERHTKKVRAPIASQLGGDTGVSDDVAQEVWLQVFLNLTKLDKPITWQAWLQTIIRRQVALFFRKKQRDLVPLDSVLDPADETEIRATDGLSIQDAVHSLAEPWRTMILLRYWKSCSYEDIAQSLSIPIGTVRSRLHKARQMLTLRLKEVHSCHGNSKT